MKSSQSSRSTGVPEVVQAVVVSDLTELDVLLGQHSQEPRIDRKITSSYACKKCFVANYTDNLIPSLMTATAFMVSSRADESRDEHG